MPFGSRKIQIEVHLKQKSSATLEFMVTQALYLYRQKIFQLYFFWTTQYEMALLIRILAFTGMQKIAPLKFAGT